LLGNRGKHFAQGCCLAVYQPRVEPATSRSLGPIVGVRHTHYTVCTNILVFTRESSYCFSVS